MMQWVSRMFYPIWNFYSSLSSLFVLLSLLYLFFFLVIFSLLLLLLLLLFVKYYHPSWILSSNTVLHSFRCVTNVCQFLCLITCRSSSTSPVHLIRCLPLFIVSTIVTVTIFFFGGGTFSLFIISVCIYHGSWAILLILQWLPLVLYPYTLIFYSPVFLLFYGTIIFFL